MKPVLGTEITLAVDIGGTKVALALFDGARIVRRHKFATEAASGGARIAEQVIQVASSWQRETPFSRCGIGFGGPVIFREQRIALSTHVRGWSGVELSRLAERELGVPAVMDNDANAGALGEARFGAGRDCDPVFYMTLSTGIGGALVTGGKIYRGADSYAGEIGHTTIRPDGPECLCGARGCYERLCSGLWLERDHGRPAIDLLEDPAFVGRYVVDLAAGLKTVIMLLNPERIVVGGGISKAGDRLFGPLDRELRRQITSWSLARAEVVPAALGDDSVLYGARALAE